MSTSAVRSMVRCTRCRCPEYMHFEDGCHTATGFVCNCKLTAEQVTSRRVLASVQNLVNDVNLVLADLDGTERSAVKVMTGFDEETIDDLGGLAS